LARDLYTTHIGAAEAQKSDGVLFDEAKSIEDKKWGYIRIETFLPPRGYDLPNEFAQRAKKYRDDKSIEGLIVDVCDNGGGNVTFAEDIVNYLRPKKEVPVNQNTASFVLSHFNKNIVEKNYENWFFDWKNDIKQSWNDRLLSGELFSKGFIFPSDGNYDDDFWWGSKPKILLTNSRCYSATDSFAACFQDNHCGVIVGNNNTTGAGGANVFTLSLLREVSSDDRSFPSMAEIG